MDNDPLKQGAVINGLKVLGSSEALPALVSALGIDQAIITIADAPQQASLRRILSICEGIPVRAQMIPAMYDLLQGKVSISELREVRVEDLLHRETVSLEEHDLVGFLGGKVVMVTGAGGSIGAELARQVARFSPSPLLLVERSEPALFTADRDLREAWPAGTSTSCSRACGRGEAVRGAGVRQRGDRQDAPPEDHHREDRGAAGRRAGSGFVAAAGAGFDRHGRRGAGLPGRVPAGSAAQWGERAGAVSLTSFVPAGRGRIRRGAGGSLGT